MDFAQTLSPRRLADIASVVVEVDTWVPAVVTRTL
jgi:hypothetical protein